MEQKHFLLSAVGVGVGVGLGLGLASGETLSRWTGLNSSPDCLTGAQIEQELVRQVVDGKDCNTTFDSFPYYLNEWVRESLTSAACVHLRHADVSKYTRKLSPASRAILLSGPAEFYQQMLAKALAHHFEAKFLLLDVTDFSLKMQRKHGCAKKDLSASEVTLGQMSKMLGSFSILNPREETRGLLQWWRGMEGGNNVSTLHRHASCSVDTSDKARQCPTNPVLTSSWCFDDKVFLQSLYKVLVSMSQSSPIILYIRDAEKMFLQSKRLYRLFHKMLNKLSGPMLVLGSRKLDPDAYCEVDERLLLLFPYNIEIKPPEDEADLAGWKVKMKEDMELIRFLDTKNHITEVLAENDLECDDIGSICRADAMVLSNYIEEIILSAISYHLMNKKDPEYRNGKLLISSRSLCQGVSIFQEGRKCGKLKENAESKKIGVIPANEIGVTFADIGASSEIKESLQELVMLPLRRPDLFTGGLLKPCRGILVFGPSGSGKKMLAKAIANEAGASFINVSISTITSKWFAEDEKNVRALFSLAAKVSPTIIFVNKVDSMLGRRTLGREREAMRKIKNEFMSHWDGLLTKPRERILVLAATNRPFDLDEAIIRRFERRIMVGLPSVEIREMILRSLLSKEKVDNLDYKELATMTDGYNRSDLKNLCATAAYQPVREFIQHERLHEKGKKQKAGQGESSEPPRDANEEKRVIALRPLNMKDMKQAKKQVAASFATEGSMMKWLMEWNNLYGEGGPRKKQQQQLTYFL